MAVVVGSMSCYRGADLFFRAKRNNDVAFWAMRMSPPGANMDRAPAEELPVAGYFPDLGEDPRVIIKMIAAWAKIAPEPCFILAPVIPPTMWWFVDNDSKFGWIEREVKPDVVARFCGWLAFLAGFPVVEKRRIGLFGFSAGAYAVVEMFNNHGCILLSGIGLGGAPGHGQRDLEGGGRRESAERYYDIRSVPSADKGA
jgi:dienelactone hydrolase